MKIELDIIRDDWKRARRGEPAACLLAHALNRRLPTEGGWSVANGLATEVIDGEPHRILTLSAHARGVAHRFDHMMPVMSRRTHLYGDARPRRAAQRRDLAPRRNRAPRRGFGLSRRTEVRLASGAVATVGGIVMVEDGLTWLLCLLGAGAAAGAVAARRKLADRENSPGSGRRQEPEMPKLSELHAMSPEQRRAVLSRRSAPHGPVTAPEPTPAPMPPAPSPSWPAAPALGGEQENHPAQTGPERATERGS